jgi:hypothetical protein
MQSTLTIFNVVILCSIYVLIGIKVNNYRYNKYEKKILANVVSSTGDKGPQVEQVTFITLIVYSAIILARLLIILGSSLRITFISSALTGILLGILVLILKNSNLLFIV